MWWMIGLGTFGVVLLAVYALLKRENPRLKLDTSRRNPASIYDRPGSGRIFSPVTVNIDPMKHMVIMDFPGHPVYNALELQVFDHPQKGYGANVLLSNVDNGEVDFYFQPTVNMNREQANVSGGVRGWTQTPLDYHYNITEAGIDAGVSLTDNEGRQIEMCVTEHRRDRRPPLNMLAPMGAGIKTPTFLPFFYMHGMDLVRQSGTDFTLTIDGEPYLPEKLPPVPHNRAGTYFVRYCGDPLIALLNEAYTGDLSPLAIQGTGQQCDGDTVYMLIDNTGHTEIQRIEQHGDGHTVHITFSPPLPDLVSLADGVQVVGRFAIGTDSIESVIVGDYTITTGDGQINMTMHPTEEWWPRTGGLPAKGTFLFFPPLFRRWMVDYYWYATITCRGETLHMTSAWEKHEQPS